MKIKLILTLIAYLWAYFVFEPSKYRLADFTIYWRASQNFYAGLDPYDLPHHSTYIEGQLGLLDKNPRVLKAWIAPFSFIPLAPLGFLDLNSAKRLYAMIFMLICLCLTHFAGRQSWRLVNRKRSQKRNGLKHTTLLIGEVSLIALLGLLSYRVISDSFSIGTMTVVVTLPCLALSASLEKSNRQFLSGFVLFPLIFKPQFFVLSLVCWSICRLRNKSYRKLLGLITSLSLALASSTLATQAWLAYRPIEFLPTLEPYAKLGAQLGAVLALSGFDIPSATLLLLMSAILLGVIIGNYANKLGMSSQQVLNITLPLSMTLAPYGWAHDYLVVLPACWVFLVYQYQDSRSWHLENVLILLYLYWLGTNRHGGHLITPLGLWNPHATCLSALHIWVSFYLLSKVSHCRLKKPKTLIT